MMTKGLVSLDEAADIGRAAVACKKKQQYNLAKMYFVESAEKMTALCKENKISKEKQEKVKIIIKSSFEQAADCERLFQQQINTLKTDKYCQEIMSNIITSPDNVTFKDIVGLAQAKKALKENLILPNLRPDLYNGIRSPSRGILFYGPAGNGKTFIAKAVSRECKATFLNISASTMVSKWMGEGEKMVKALFHVANIYQPSIIFIDEIDSLLSERKENDHEASRRLKTEFLVQFDGLNNSPTDRISLIGATNLPHYLDTAALRRFGKRIYITLPDEYARAQIITQCLGEVKHSLTDKEIGKVARSLENYSASDITNLVKEAAMGPFREYSDEELRGLSKYDIRAVQMKDFEAAKRTVLASVTNKDVMMYLEWENKLGKGN